MAWRIWARPAAGKLREDYSAEALRSLAKRSKVNQSRRLLSLAAVRDGRERGEAAKIGGMDRQTLRDGVHRFNAQGPDGLFDHWTEGPTPRLSADQLAQLATIVETGPDPKDGQRGALASGRSQGGDIRALRRRLSRTLCRKAPEEARVLAHERTSPPSGAGRANRRGF